MCHVFPRLTIEKLKASIFDDPQIRQLIRDSQFENSTIKEELEAVKIFVLVGKTFLYNKKEMKYEELVTTILTTFWNFECNMSLKMHYLVSHIDWFPKNLESMSKDQGEWFHQEMKVMKTLYQGRWDAVMMADYCWRLMRDIPSAEHSMISRKHQIKPWILNNDGLTCNWHVLIN